MCVCGLREFIIERLEMTFVHRTKVGNYICSGLSGTWCAYFMILDDLLIHMLRVEAY